MKNYDITLKVTNHQLIEVFEILSIEPPEMSYYDSKQQSKMKHFYSLWADVRAKLGKKVLNTEGNHKPSNFKLKYYEAATLHQIMSVYERSHYAQQLFDQLDQKLA